MNSRVALALAFAAVIAAFSRAETAIGDDPTTKAKANLRESWLTDLPTTVSVPLQNDTSLVVGLPAHLWIQCPRNAPTGTMTFDGDGIVLQDIIDQAFARANLGQPVAPRLLLCVDETANTPLWKLPEWASTLTATGTQLVTVWQSKAQMDELYGHHADTLLTNYRTKLIFPSGLSDMTTAKFISELVGDEAVRSEIEDRRLLTPTSGRRSPGDRSPASSTPFLPPHVLRAASPGDALVIHGSLPPAWVPYAERR